MDSAMTTLDFADDSVSTVGEKVIFLTEKYELKKYLTIFSEIPLHYFIVMCSLIIFLSFSLNLLVFLYYRKSNEVTRLYILAYVVIDGLSIASCFIPLFALWYVDLSDGWNQIVFIFLISALNSSFGLYLYPSLFLALDRFLVVMFPLTFHRYVTKLRIVKAVWLSLQVMFTFLNTANRVMLGIDSILSQILKILLTFTLIFVLLTICVVYTIMVVQIIRSSKKMATSRQVGQNDM